MRGYTKRSGNNDVVNGILLKEISERLHRTHHYSSKQDSDSYRKKLGLILSIIG